MRSGRFMIGTAVAAMCAFGVPACAGDGSAGEKSGGDAGTLTLRLGTVEGKAAPYSDEVEEFAKSVETLADGSLDVEIAWESVGPYNAESEQKMATMARDGEVDLAVVPTRVWDQLDVTSLQALQAPFLVDNLGLLNEIAESDLADEMMAGLDAVGVEGLALWPESLRHPISYDAPLLTAADFHGAKLRVPISDASYRLARAIGVEPVDPPDWGAAVAEGDMDGAESAFAWSSDLPMFGTFTANITFYPKVNTLVANDDTFDMLTDDQQDLLRRAAADTLSYVIETNATEHELAADYCAVGGSVVLAQESDLAELAAMAAPVLAELEQDADTARLIDEIRTLKQEATTDPAASPAACQPADDGPGSSDSSAETEEFPEGVYRTDSPLDGVVTMTFIDGVWQRISENGHVDCEATYVVEAGRIRLTTSTDPALDCDDPPGREFLDAVWTLEGDQLRFIDINSGPGAVQEFGLPWTKIE